MKVFKFFHQYQSIILMTLAGLVIRLILSPFGTLSLDHGTFVAWSNILKNDGFVNFYTNWSDYLPGYLYVLSLLANIHQVININTEILYKIPAILADLATGVLIYKIVKQTKSEKLALLSSGLYIFNPAIFANSTLWGQVDTFISLFSLLSVYFARKKSLLSSVFLGLGTVVKPQAALVGIVILFMMLRDRWSVKKILLYGLVGLVTFSLVFVPFLPNNNLVGFIQERLNTTLNQYKFTSVNAFNFWGLSGFWQPDGIQQTLGGLMTLGVSLLVAYKLYKTKGTEYLLLTVVFLTGFLFMTRLHERHMLPVLAPLIVVAASYPGLIFSYILLSFVYVTNLYYAFIWITNDFKEIFSPSQIKLLIIINFLAFANLLLVSIKGIDIFQKGIFKRIKISIKESRPQTKLEDKLPKKRARVFLSLILIFSFVSRIAFLASPEKEYFDEVYHAFTAKVLLHGDAKGWEWWNPNPEGFAYEWTHPPIAKEAMIIGMSIFGENSLGWRIPAAIFGTLSVLLVYLISRKLFDNREVGLLASFLFSLDGLPLVMSRIGMNDAYLLFFILASLYFFIKEKNFLSAICLGFAAASKWSTMWFLPVIVLAHFALKKKIRPSYFWFLIVPPLVYLGSYIPFFSSGHTIEQFIELQKQMWWYHTKLVATHDFSSPWWSWPLNIRPVWMYVNYLEEGKIANIYAQSNPAVIWFSLLSAIVCFYWAIKERSKKLAFLVFAYLIFFVSWSISPRIMFFYHFLPSTPFMAILGGYVLKKAPSWRVPIFMMAVVLFIYFYPHWTGIVVPQTLNDSYFWFPSWK